MHEVTRLPIVALFDNEDQRQLYVDIYTALVEAIKLSLTPDLLKPEYRKENADNPMFGHCYVASEAFYHMMDQKHLRVCYGKDERNITHWWILNETLHLRIDPTCDQYYSQGLIPPYHNQKKASFLTNEPSKRAKVVIDRVLEVIK